MTQKYSLKINLRLLKVKRKMGSQQKSRWVCSWLARGDLRNKTITLPWEIAGFIRFPFFVFKTNTDEVLYMFIFNCCETVQDGRNASDSQVPLVSSWIKPTDTIKRRPCCMSDPPRWSAHETHVRNKQKRGTQAARLSGTVFKQRKSQAVRNGLLFGRGVILEQIEIGLWQRQVVASPCHPVWLRALLAHYSKTGEVGCFDSQLLF